MGLKKFCLLAVLALATGLVFAPSGLAQTGQTDVCPTYDGKYEIEGGGWEGPAASGIRIVSAGGNEVRIEVAAGYTLSAFCYKTGSGGGGATSAEAPIVGPATFTITKTVAGGGISHVTFDVGPTPADVCPNIEGVQAEVPAGMVKDAQGNCVTPPTDVCPNIEGVQTALPEGFVLENGMCVYPPRVTTVVEERVVEKVVTVLVPQERIVEKTVTVTVPAQATVVEKVVTRVVTKVVTKKAKRAAVKGKRFGKKAKKPRVLPRTR
ncbi:MAG: hypothetical protein ICV59_07780 [Thermoleophilia bacterium]|nr:hypothetical protein [Thermoleophilia bacterium]